MNILNPISSKPIRCSLSLNPQRPSLAKPFSSSLSFRIPPPPPPVKASLQNPQNFIKYQIRSNNPNSIPFLPLLAPLKSTLITTIAAAAIFFSGLCFPLKPSIAAATFASPPSTVESKDTISDEEKERFLEEQLISNPSDVNVLKNLMEIKIKSKKLPEAIEILDRLIELEPDEIEWPMMKAHLYAYDGDFILAKNGFNELLKKDPFRVEAYHGLVTVASQEESSEELRSIEKRVEEAIQLCEKEKKGSDLRDFKLLLAQIRVLEGSYDDALKVYDDLVKEEPRDFRPYLCQGIIYTLLRKNNEAEKSFEKYRRLVPKGHPYASYFDDNMIATKIFAQKVENERAMAKS
ncbi:hypothetical protein ACJIZ3_021997 [Penstemon smallii]|uniref:Uncharacterized protein n=1 Tax=Penstemon smallii TaxID=265156 RepID=A0ABD3SN95_9LAMI